MGHIPPRQKAAAKAKATAAKAAAVATTENENLCAALSSLATRRTSDGPNALGLLEHQNGAVQNLMHLMSAATQAENHSSPAFQNIAAGLVASGVDMSAYITGVGEALKGAQQAERDAEATAKSGRLPPNPILGDTMDITGSDEEGGDYGLTDGLETVEPPRTSSSSVPNSAGPWACECTLGRAKAAQNPPNLNGCASCGNESPYFDPNSEIGRARAASNAAHVAATAAAASQPPLPAAPRAAAGRSSAESPFSIDTGADGRPPKTARLLTPAAARAAAPA
ncbi:hypothetical protein T492DRAFT_846799 [Pavlovales sp. CCMP2436]|nr:hypothetical protein T492DRAFT_846799 [Pavlovales sp. CCMP2436]